MDCRRGRRRIEMASIIKRGTDQEGRRGSGEEEGG